MLVAKLVIRTTLCKIIMVFYCHKKHLYLYLTADMMPSIIMVLKKKSVVLINVQSYGELTPTPTAIKRLQWSHNARAKTTQDFVTIRRSKP